MSKSKKPNRVNEGFRIANLLSPTEVSYARTTSRGIKADVDKADFTKDKAEHRKNEIADISFLENTIKNVKPLIIEPREKFVEEPVEEEAQEEVVAV